MEPQVDLLKTKNIEPIKTKDFMLSMESFSLVYDQEKFLFQTIPVPENLDKYYESDAYISHTDSKESFFDKVYQFAKSFNLKKKLSWTLQGSKTEKLLDVGCGTGDFLNLAKANGLEVDGVEINKSARKISEEKLNQSIFTSISELQGKQYDRITLWHVLEHLNDFEGSIEQLKDLLNPGGVLIIAVPNFKSFDAQYYKSYWAAYDTPRHLWHFSRETFYYLKDKYNLEYLQDKGMVLDSFYVSLLSEKYKKNVFGVIRAFFIGFWSNMSALYSRQHSSQVYFLKKHT